ncbi:hypothetical protein LQK80_29830 [Bacillus thuringiensis]|nr:hypothetical protein [Bacillus thuringiensis]
MTEQITIDHDFIYEPLIDTYMVDIVTESGFKLEFCEAETKEEAGLKIRKNIVRIIVLRFVVLKFRIDR